MNLCSVACSQLLWVFHLPRLVNLRPVVVNFGVGVEFCALLDISIALFLEVLTNLRVLSHHVVTVSACL